MEASPLKLQAHKCDGNNFFLRDCVTKIKVPYGSELYEEYKLILLRSGMDPNDENSMNLEICSNHRRILGKEFLKYIHQNDCYHVKHVPPTKDKASRMITYKEAVSFLKCTFLTLPLGLPICSLCHSNVIKAIDTEAMDTQPSEASTELSTFPSPNERRLLDFSFTSEDAVQGGSEFFRKAVMEYGYRHLDTAMKYGNESEVGDAL